MSHHLWETPHSYYATTGNFFKNGYHSVFKSWEEFARTTKKGSLEGNFLYDFDDDLNVLWRWDWMKANEDDFYLVEGDPDNQIEEYREACETDTLFLFFMAPRKGYNMSAEVTVVESEEPEIRAWLERKWKYMKNIWEPLS